MMQQSSEREEVRMVGCEVGSGVVGAEREQSERPERSGRK